MMRDMFALRWLLAFLAAAAGWLFLFSLLTTGEVAPSRATAGQAGEWFHLSTAAGDLAPPSESTQQVLTLVLDVDNDGDNDFVIGSRRSPGRRWSGIAGTRLAGRAWLSKPMG